MVVAFASHMWPQGACLRGTSWKHFKDEDAEGSSPAFAWKFLGASLWDWKLEREEPASLCTSHTCSSGRAHTCRAHGRLSPAPTAVPDAWVVLTGCSLDARMNSVQLRLGVGRGAMPESWCSLRKTLMSMQGLPVPLWP